MALPGPGAGQLDTSRPSIARIRDYWLGGTHHDEADRGFAEQIVVCAPHLPYLVRAQNAFVRRLVRYLIERGVRQFLDLGSGIPDVGAVHRVAHEVDPGAKVVYVDLDPAIEQDSAELLAGVDNVTLLRADVRRTDDVLGAPAVNELIDFAQPVAVLRIEFLLHLQDSEDPADLVASYSSALASGSYLGIAHFSQDEQLQEGLTLFSRMFGAPPAVTLREPCELVGFFTGMDLVEPGIVPVPLWKPGPSDEHVRNPELVQVHAGLGRKS